MIDPKVVSLNRANRTTTVLRFKQAREVLWLNPVAIAAGVMGNAISVALLPFAGIGFCPFGIFRVLALPICGSAFVALAGGRSAVHITHIPMRFRQAAVDAPIRTREQVDRPARGHDITQPNSSGPVGSTSSSPLR